LNWLFALAKDQVLNIPYILYVYYEKIDKFV